MTQSGKLKLRAGAVWVDPGYRERHEALLVARRVAMSAREVAAELASETGLPFGDILRAVQSAFASLRKSGQIVRGPDRGAYLAAEVGEG